MSAEPPGRHVSERWRQWRATVDLDEYHRRFERVDPAQDWPHGEADCIESLQPRSVVDAGCGMGRVAIELSRRGIDVVGIDLDADLLEFAKRAAPAMRWVHADLATVDLGERFDVVLCRNVLIYFDKDLQTKVHELFYDSLAMFGLLCLGSKESMRFMRHEQCYESITSEKIFRKVR